MPCGRMSIASRSRSCDLRASATAASTSARLRTISPISPATRRSRFAGFGLALTGRPGIRGIAACFSFFCFLGRMFGISTPYSHFRESKFCDKCLKKWYLSDFSQFPAQSRRASSGDGNDQPVSAPCRINHVRSNPKGELPMREDKILMAYTIGGAMHAFAPRARNCANDTQGYRTVKTGRSGCDGSGVAAARLHVTLWPFE